MIDIMIPSQIPNLEVNGVNVDSLRFLLKYVFSCFQRETTMLHLQNK